MAQLDFWYSIGSTYTYLTVMRIEDTARAAGVSVNWRPYNVRHVMTLQNNIPFKDKPVKTAYMWRDIERQSMKYGLSPHLPAPYPIADLPRANRVALLGMEEGWGAAYTRATYLRWFEAGQPAGEDPNLGDSLTEIGQDPARVLRESESERISEALAAATEEAMSKGVFGAPSFMVGDEVFWGDDRLEDALNWALTHG